MALGYLGRMWVGDGGLVVPRECNKGASVLHGNVISKQGVACAGTQMEKDLFCFHAFVNN